ncbi:HAD hydrolase-like protein [Paenibacillus sp. P26]|nr:HAD hydrolase-like protein [Paenibacillus sp. P26]UUZ89827.1 HAD hydrolase-like protein [Paenibacillus sp. P25]
MEAVEHFGKSISYETADNFEEMFRSISKSRMKINLQVSETLETLRGMYRMGIVTNGTTARQYDKIEALGIKHLFPSEVVS